MSPAAQPHPESAPREPAEWRGSPSRLAQFVMILIAWYAMLALATFAILEKIDSRGDVASWTSAAEVVAGSAILLIGALLVPVSGGFGSFLGSRVVTRLDTRGVTIDRRALGRGVLRVPWQDVEAIQRKGLGVGLRLRSYDGLLDQSDDAALRKISRGLLLCRIFGFLEYFTGAEGVINAIARRRRPVASVSERNVARMPSTVAFLRVARRFSEQEVDFPLGERDIGAKAFAERAQRYLDASRGSAHTAAR